MIEVCVKIVLFGLCTYNDTASANFMLESKHSRCPDLYLSLATALPVLSNLRVSDSDIQLASSIAGNPVEMEKNRSFHGSPQYGGNQLAYLPDEPFFGTLFRNPLSEISSRRWAILPEDAASSYRWRHTHDGDGDPSIEDWERRPERS